MVLGEVTGVADGARVVPRRTAPAPIAYRRTEPLPPVHAPTPRRGPSGGDVISRFRAVFARYVPPGAVLLGVLTFAAYAAGLVRDRIFARTYGAGAELDAYNAAFVLPELALDVLVAAGLTAPFVPVFTTLRRRTSGGGAPVRADGAHRSRSASWRDRACVMLFCRAPSTVQLIAPGLRRSRRRRCTSTCSG